MLDWYTYNPLAKLVGFSLIFLAGIIALVLASEAQWAEFSREHDCKIVAKTAGHTGYGLTHTGQMGTVYVPGRTTYRCNDGVDYTR